MNKEEYFRAVGKKLLEIKALADEYEGGCDYLSLAIINGHLTFDNSLDKDHYDFFFNIGDDIEEEVIEDGHMNWIRPAEEF